MRMTADSTQDPAVAVLGFKNLSGRPDEAWLSIALAEMLTTEVGAGEKLRTIPGENVARMKTNLSLVDADSYGADTLRKIPESESAATRSGCERRKSMGRQTPFAPGASSRRRSRMRASRRQR